MSNPKTESIKRARKNQRYEDYWKITLEYSDFSEKKFNLTLKTIVDYIDEFNGDITHERYKELQEKLNKLIPKKDLASQRKTINQFLKLGFINNECKSYHKKTKYFLQEKDVSRKKRIYSEILYDNASFKRSMTNPTSEKELNFLIKTLEHCGSLTKDNVLAMMFQDIKNYPKGYLTLEEIKKLTEQITNENAIDRKYNQIRFLWSICTNILTGVYKTSENRITLDKQEEIKESLKKGRDPYKQRLYKFDLYEESKIKNNKIACYYDGISYPVLIASHIKPYASCNESEQFDVNNGLLLSRNIDQLFDAGWISFTDDGVVLCADNLDENLKNKLKENTLNKKFLCSPKRLEYLKYHREKVFTQNNKYSYNKDT